MRIVVRWWREMTRMESMHAAHGGMIRVHQAIAIAIAGNFLQEGLRKPISATRTEFAPLHMQNPVAAASGEMIWAFIKSLATSVTAKEIAAAIASNRCDCGALRAWIPTWQKKNRCKLMDVQSWGDIVQGIWFGSIHAIFLATQKKGSNCIPMICICVVYIELKRKDSLWNDYREVTQVLEEARRDVSHKIISRRW